MTKVKSGCIAFFGFVLISANILTFSNIYFTVKTQILEDSKTSVDYPTAAVLDDYLPNIKGTQKVESENLLLQVKQDLIDPIMQEEDQMQMAQNDHAINF